ncbi:uncharacterized protein B0T23DRAFT_309622 [Neurospora hispaniola]|uniref:Uncharacterized protein n=1 Tax=Neurospora hispaniola TaxID=588809 RepID=A0AAJ0IC02_9PEZI|nr:hypothetical protein B0T23DRAFT_309622 [Neurospora hispaniola]
MEDHLSWFLTIVWLGGCALTTVVTYPFGLCAFFLCTMAIAHPVVAWEKAEVISWKLVERLLEYVDLVYLFRLFLSVSTGLVLAVLVTKLVRIGLKHPRYRKVCRRISRCAETVWFVASKGVSAWKVFSQWVLRFSQAVRLRQQRTGKVYLSLDKWYLLVIIPRYVPPPTPTPSIAPDNQTVDQSEMTVEHQAVPQYLLCQREGWQGSENLDDGHLVNRSTREDVARPIASPVIPEQAEHIQVAKSTTAVSAFDVVHAGPAPPRPSIPERVKGLELLMEKTAREMGISVEQFKAHCEATKSPRIVEEAAPGSTAPNQPQLPEADTQHAPQPMPVRSTRYERVLKKLSKSRRHVPAPRYDLFQSDSVYEEMVPESLMAVAVSRPAAVAEAPISEPVVITEPSVAPEPIHAEMKLTPPEIVITPPSPVLVSRTIVEDRITGSGISSMPDKLAPEPILTEKPIQEIVTVSSVPPSVVSQLQLSERNTVSEQEIEDLRLRLEVLRISPSVAVSTSVDEQKTVGNGVQSPLQVPVLATLASPADDLVPSVVDSVEDSVLMEPVSARPSDDDVDMGEDSSVLSLAGLVSNGVAHSEVSPDHDLAMTDIEVATTVNAGLSDDQQMQDGDDSHQDWMHEESPIVSSDMELFPPQQSPETIVFGGQAVQLVPLGSQQPIWQLPSVFPEGQTDFNFEFTMPSLIQPQNVEHDMVDVPQSDMVTTFSEYPMVEMTSPFNFVQTDTTMEGHFDYPAPPALTPGQQQQPWNIVEQPTAATFDRVLVSDTIDFNMLVDPNLDNMFDNVVSPMAPQPSPVSVTAESGMGLVTPASQAVDNRASPVTSEQRPVVADILPEFDINSVHPDLRYVDTPLDVAVTQGIAPAVEQPSEQDVPQQQPEQEVSQSAPATDEYPGVEVCEPEAWAQLQVLQNYVLEHDAEENNWQSEYPDLPQPSASEYPEPPEHPAEIDQTQEMGSPTFTPDVDDGASNGSLVLSPPGTPTSIRSWDYSLFGSPPPVCSAPTPPNRSPTPPRSTGLDFTNAVFQPTLPVGAPVFTSVSTFQPILPAAAPGSNQASPSNIFGEDFRPDHTTPDDPDFRLHEAVWTMNEVDRMHQAYLVGQRLTQADVASASLQVEIMRQTEGADIYTEHEEDSDCSIESSDEEVRIPISQRRIAMPRSRASRAMATAPAPAPAPVTPSTTATPPAGEIIPPAVSDSPGEEQDAERDFTDLELELLGMVSEDEEGPQRADEEVIRRRPLAKLPRRRRNLPSHSNTGN